MMAALQRCLLVACAATALQPARTPLTVRSAINAPVTEVKPDAVLNPTSKEKCEVPPFNKVMAANRS